MVSFNIDGKDSISDICRICQDKIISLTQLPFQNETCVTISNVECEKLNDFIDILKKEKGISVSVKDEQILNIKYCYCINGYYHAHVTLTYYKNKTLFLQGIFNMFFVEIRNEIIDLLAVTPPNIVDDFLSQEKMESKVVETDLDKLFPKIDENILKNSVLETFIITSAKLLNQSYPEELQDYGFITFDILKAIDGLMRKKLCEDRSFVDKYDMFCWDSRTNTYKFKKNYIIYNDNLTLKRALEHGYTFFNRQRNTTFHVDNRNIDTSRILSFEDAVGIFTDSIKIITEICKSW